MTFSYICGFKFIPYKKEIERDFMPAVYRIDLNFDIIHDLPR